MHFFPSLQIVILGVCGNRHSLSVYTKVMVVCSRPITTLFPSSPSVLERYVNGCLTIHSGHDIWRITRLCEISVHCYRRTRYPAFWPNIQIFSRKCILSAQISVRHLISVNKLRPRLCFSSIYFGGCISHSICTYCGIPHGSILFHCYFYSS